MCVCIEFKRPLLNRSYALFCLFSLVCCFVPQADLFVCLFEAFCILQFAFSTWFFSPYMMTSKWWNIVQPVHFNRISSVELNDRRVNIVSFIFRNNPTNSVTFRFEHRFKIVDRFFNYTFALTENSRLLFPLPSQVYYCFTFLIELGNS